MKMTLLEIVQSVLGSADDDNVNDIDATESAVDAARVAKEVYFEIVDSGDWEHLNKIAQMASVSDATQPHVLNIPDGIVLLDYENVFKYDKTETGDTDTKIEDVEYVDNAEFMRIVTNRKDSSSNMTKYTGYDSIPMIIQTDKMPDYWTSFDDERIVMDSFHSTTETWLQGSKCFVKCKEIPTWTENKDFIPDMPHNMFSWYLSKVKVKYHAYHTQKSDIIDAQETHSGKARHRRKGSTTGGRRIRKSYGRSTRGS